MQTSSTYTLTRRPTWARRSKVEVTFEDDADNPETLTSDATNPVVPAAAACGLGLGNELWCAQLHRRSWWGTPPTREPDMDGAQFRFDLRRSGFRDATNWR